MTNHKYDTEFGLVLCSKNTAMLRPAEIEAVRQDVVAMEFLKHCHIYAVGKRPRLVLSPTTLSHDEEFVYGHISCRQHGRLLSAPFRMPRRQFSPAVERFAATEYPHTKLLALSHRGEQLHAIPVVFLAPYLTPKARFWSDLKIMYIGQAYGKDGSRTALDRLKDHSTLQRIQADVIANDPDSDLLLILFEYDSPTYLMLMDGKGRSTIKGEKNLVHVHSVMNSTLSEAEIVTIAEAGLIRYFQPYFNTVYKDNFPSTNLKSLRQCYDLDFSALTVEIDTEELHITYFRPRLNDIFIILPTTICITMRRDAVSLTSASYLTSCPTIASSPTALPRRF